MKENEIKKLGNQTIVVSIDKRRRPCARPSCILVEDLHDVLRTDLGKNDNHHPAQKGKHNKRVLTYLFIAFFNFDPITCAIYGALKVVHLSYAARRSQRSPELSTFLTS